MAGENDGLKRRWADLWVRLGISSDRVPSIDPLIDAYQSPGRRYHNLLHVRDCLAEFHDVRHLCSNPDAVEFAIVYHDVVYDPTRGDNERRSADVAAEALRSAAEDAALIERVVALVLATKHDAAPEDEDARILADIDLSILGRGSDEFDAYDRAIRLEYAHVPDEAFRAGRAAILRRFLDRPAIFGTPILRSKYEAAARENLRRSVERLTNP